VRAEIGSRPRQIAFVLGTVHVRSSQAWRSTMAAALSIT
jgi:hypothetical protein